MDMRRFTRLTNGSSKKVANQAAMVAPLCITISRIHDTLRITAAMAAGISDHVWPLREIVLLAN